MQKKDCIEFEQVVERSCGMDVHKETVVVTIRGKDIKSVTKELQYVHTFFDKVEGVATETWDYPYSYGEYRSVLEAGFQCIGR